MHIGIYLLQVKHENHRGNLKFTCNQDSERNTITICLELSKGDVTKFDNSWPKQLISPMLNTAYQSPFTMNWLHVITEGFLSLLF